VPCGDGSIDVKGRCGISLKSPWFQALFGFRWFRTGGGGNLSKGNPAQKV